MTTIYSKYVTFGFAGKVVAGYRVRTLNNGIQKWDLLGKRDPMTPQMFYPIENNITVKYGDIMVSRSHELFIYDNKTYLPIYNLARLYILYM